MFKEIIAAYSIIHTKPKNTVCGQNSYYSRWYTVTTELQRFQLANSAYIHPDRADEHIAVHRPVCW
jgi:hypothetical protein